MRWLMRKLGYMPKAEYDRLGAQYQYLTSEFQATIEKYNMQGAWEQVKQERKHARMH